MECNGGDFYAQALRFYGSFNPTVTGITILNSPQCHLKFDNCNGVLVHNVSISSPGNSPNTDGIHLQNSKDVLIYGSTMACGNISLTCATFSFILKIYYEGHVVDRDKIKVKMKTQDKRRKPKKTVIICMFYDS